MMERAAHLSEEFKRLRAPGWWRGSRSISESFSRWRFVDRSEQNIAFAASRSMGALFNKVLSKVFAFKVMPFYHKKTSSPYAHKYTSFAQRVRPHTSLRSHELFHCLTCLPLFISHHPLVDPLLISAYSRPSPSLSPSPSATPQYHLPHW